MTKVRYVGLDVHKDSIVIAVAEAGDGEVRELGKIPDDWPLLQRKLARAASGGYELRLCYEAGPTGYELHRRHGGRVGKEDGRWLSVSIQLHGNWSAVLQHAG